MGEELVAGTNIDRDSVNNADSVKDIGETVEM